MIFKRGSGNNETGKSGFPHQFIPARSQLVRNVKFLFPLWILIFSFTRSYSSEIDLPDIYSDNMVIQADEPFIIKGRSGPFEHISVQVLQTIKKSIADQQGNWQIEFSAFTYSEPFDIIIETDADKKIIRNAVIGEIWLCSGQSNMAMSASRADVIKKINYSDTDKIRYFLAQNDPSETGQDQLKGKWVVCTAQNIGRCSAVGLSFAWYLNRSLHKTVGLIINARGGTPVESWTKLDILKEKEYNRHIFQQREQWQKDRNIYQSQYDREMKDWQLAAEKARENGTPPPPMIWPPFQLRKDWNPGSLYNALIYPLRDFTFRGVLWYQGESNSNYPSVYRNQLADMINCWRDLFKDQQLPFYIIQLPEFKTADNWVLMRESQASVAGLKHNSLVVTLGLGDSSNIHPTQKMEVGHRAALQALKNEYKFQIVSSGPVLKSMKIAGNTIKLQFDCFGSTIQSADGQPIRNMEIAGSDLRFLPAQVHIDGTRLIVWNDKIKHPRTLRYAWQNAPQKINFVNNENLPAPPFLKVGSRRTPD